MKSKLASAFFYLQIVLLLFSLYIDISDYVANNKNGDIGNWIGWYLAFYWIFAIIHYAVVAVLSVIPCFVFFKHFATFKKIVYISIMLFLLSEPIIVYQYYKSIPQNPKKGIEFRLYMPH